MTVNIIAEGKYDRWMIYVIQTYYAIFNNDMFGDSVYHDVTVIFRPVLDR